MTLCNDRMGVARAHGMLRVAKIARGRRGEISALNHNKIVGK